VITELSLVVSVIVVGATILRPVLDASAAADGTPLILGAAHDHHEAAAFMTAILGLPPPPVALGPFALVHVGPITTLDVVTVDGAVDPQHYAFLVTEAEFDEIFARIRDRALPSRHRSWIPRDPGSRSKRFTHPHG
jgi:hypothetical protein